MIAFSFLTVGFSAFPGEYTRVTSYAVMSFEIVGKWYRLSDQYHTAGFFLDVQSLFTMLAGKQRPQFSQCPSVWFTSLNGIAGSTKKAFFNVFVVLITVDLQLQHYLLESHRWQHFLCSFTIFDALFFCCSFLFLVLHWWYLDVPVQFIHSWPCWVVTTNSLCNVIC